MIHLILFLKVFVFSIWTQQMFACSNSKIRTKLEICSQLTIKTLEWCHWHRSSVFILNLEQFSHLILVLQFWIGNSLLGRMISQTKPLKIKYLFPFNFGITKICVAIFLARDGTRMDSTCFQLSPSRDLGLKGFYLNILGNWVCCINWVFFSPWLRLNSITQSNLNYLVLSGIKAFTADKKAFIPILLDSTFLHSHILFPAVRFTRSCISEKRFYLVFELRLELSTFDSTKKKIKNFH